MNSRPAASGAACAAAGWSRPVTTAGNSQQQRAEWQAARENMGPEKAMGF
jgi:hypothetical protein